MKPYGRLGVGMATLGAAIVATIGRRGNTIMELKDRPGPAPEAKSRRVREAPEPDSAPPIEAESRQVRRARERRASKQFK